MTNRVLVLSLSFLLIASLSVFGATQLRDEKMLQDFEDKILEIQENIESLCLLTPELLAPYPTSDRTYSIYSTYVAYDTIGYTYWDTQCDDSQRRMIAKDYLGNLHFTWMNATYYDFEDRYVDYNARYTNGTWLEAGGMHVTPSAGRGGYCGLDILPNSKEVIAGHMPGTSGNPTSMWFTFLAVETSNPGYGVLKLFDVPDSCAGSGYHGQWPTLACSKVMNGDTAYIHITQAKGDTVHASPKDLGYIRCFEKPSNKDTLVCMSPGWGFWISVPKNTKLVPNKIPYRFATAMLSGATVATSPVNQKVTVVWLQSSGSSYTQNELMYLESTNNGNDWMLAGNMGTPVQITNYAAGGYVDRAWPDIAAVYDYNGVLHVVWTTYKSTDQNDVDLWHWSSTAGIRKVASATATDVVVPGVWNLLIAKPTLGVGCKVGDAAYNYLYVTYTKFRDGDISANGYANGDIYLKVSANGGLTWGPEINLTNTSTNGCAAGTCRSENWASIAERVDDYLYVQYIYDRDAGAAPYGEGYTTYNPVQYLKVPRPLVPGISSLTIAPEQNELNVPVSANISATFYIDMDATTINDSTFIVNARSSGKHQGSVSYDSLNRTATFNPSSDFKPGELVTAILTKDMKSSQGVPPCTNCVWSFTTAVHDGAGIYWPRTNYSVGDRPHDILAADFDNDGDLDLATPNEYSDTISILLNNGDGTFAPQTRYQVGDLPLRVCAADLNGDGHLDLVTANYLGNNISVLLNNGDGTFATQVLYPVGTNPRSVFAADFDGDGDLDLTTANDGSNNISVLLNNGNGSFASHSVYSTANTPYYVHAADLDGDGDLDIATANLASNNISILFNYGNATFSTHSDYATSNRPYYIYAADFDNDGDLDLATPNDVSDNVSILLNNGNGTFAPQTVYSAGDNPLCAFPADLNGDGNLDLVTANSLSDNISILLNNGSGSFTPDTVYAVGDYPYAVFAADLDGNGYLDLITANHDSDSITVLLNLPCGDVNADRKITVSDVVYLINYLFKGGPAPVAMKCADANGDGKVTVSDVVYLINYLFKGGPAPAC